MPSAIASSREILTRLHEVMASRAPVETKLSQVVAIVGEALASEVCSIYLLREGALELFATRGLNQAAVHVTRLAFGEGLVGTIAANGEPLNLAEAHLHPAFAYRPETGEELFHSFAGVPIVRRERSVGVLAVQHELARRYDEVEIEALQTVAMVLAELIANAGLIDDRGPGPRMASTQPVKLTGFRLVEGVAMGHVAFHRPHIVIEHTVAEDVETERRRVYNAFAKMRDQFDAMLAQSEFGVDTETRDVIETYKMFAYDEGWARRINEAIDSGLTAEAAIERVRQHTRMRMRQIDDPLLSERMNDLDDLANRLQRIVSGQMSTAARAGLRRDSILVARNLGPAELLEYDRRWLKGLILGEGSLTAHVTIVARAMGVPVLGRVKNIRRDVGEGDMVLLDVALGSAIVRPSPAQEEAFQSRIATVRQRHAIYAAQRGEPAITRDGVRIEVMMNAGLRDDAMALRTTGADGIGLFRTEFQFLVSATLPRRQQQYRLYRDVLDAAGDLPVVFRTVDIGGDKALPYLHRFAEGTEENPAMGWRALRVALEREGLMKSQARALIDAAADRQLSVMFPMISEPWEFHAARALFERQYEWARARGRVLPQRVRFGAMLEVPGLAETLDLLLPHIDFLSIGTNDLTQFLFAADRAHPKLAERYDWVSPAVLRFIARVTLQAQAAGVPVSACGEMGGRPVEAMALLALGINRLSITPAAIGPIKAMIRSLDLGATRNFVADLLRAPPEHPRKLLTDWATQQGVALD